MEAGLQWLGGRAILNSANLEDGEAPGHAARPGLHAGPRVRRGRRSACCIDEEGQARDVEWKLRVAHRIHDLAVDRYGLEPGDLIFDALTFPLVTGDDDLRGDGIGHDRGHPPHQGRAARRAHHPRAVERLVRPQAGGPARPQLRLPARGAPRPGSTRPSCTRRGSCRSTAIPEEQRRSASTSSTTAARDDYDPLQALLDVFEDVSAADGREGGPLRLAGRAAPLQRIIDGDRDGLEDRPRRGPGRRPQPRSPSSTTSCSPA